MQKNNIQPENITKPIQLLAVWLVGLILLVSSLLTAASILETPPWLSPFLAVSAVALIPIFLILIFLLQTKYRPEMQEDVYYEKYLNKDTNRFELIKSVDDEQAIRMVDLIEMSNKMKIHLDKISQSLSVLDDNNYQKEKIEPFIQDSEAELKELSKKIKLDSIDLKINKSLASYDGILEIIKTIGFTKYDEFGAGYAPNDLLISFGKRIPVEIIKDLITKLATLENGYLKESTTATNAIIIGSYRTQDFKTKIDDDLLNKLSNLETEQTIRDLIPSKFIN